MATTAGPLRVELYLRTDTFGTYDAQEEILERIATLEAEGKLADTTVEDDWDRLRTPEADTSDDAIQTYEEFQAWAETNGYSLEPAFEYRDRSFVGSERAQEVVTFPIVSLAVYDDRDLTGVFPVTDGGVAYTVQDCLAAFEEDRIDAWLQQFSSVTVDRSGPRIQTPVRP